MKIRFSFKKSFLHRIYFYICFGVLIPLLLCGAIELRTTPMKNERFTIFLAADLKPESTLSSSIGNYLKDYKNKQVNFDACDPQNSFFSAHYGSYGLLSDVLILTPKALDQVDKGLFIEIPSSNEFYSPTNYIDENQKHLGIYFGNGKTCPWQNDVDYKEENYYIFVNINTVHGQYFQDDYQDDQVSTFIRNVLNEKK